MALLLLVPPMPGLGPAAGLFSAAAPGHHGALTGGRPEPILAE
jgi:hypothetical protein